MKVSVVIATYRRSSSLGRTLSSIAGQQRRPDEIIVIDQSPSEERDAVVAALGKATQAGLNVRAIWSDVPSSTHARNLGLKAATGDWVIFSDDDVDWPASVTGDFVAKIKESPELVMLAARDTLTTVEHRPFWRRAFAAIFLTNTFSQLGYGKVMACMQGRYPRPIIGDMETEWATGYWFAVERGFVAAHHLQFDERMSRYAQAEDMLFSHQVYLAAKRAGRRCVVSEGIAVAHLVSQEWREPDSFADLCGAWNRIYIASTLRQNAGFWISLAAIYWAAVHQTIVRVVRCRPIAGHLRAYLLALCHLGEIRAGRFERLYAQYEKPTGHVT